MKLTAENVQAVTADCLYRDDEIDANGDFKVAPVYVEGIVNKYGFHPERLHSHARDVRTMLTDLPSEFYASIGGGWSFLNLCMRTNHSMWTGLHRDQEFLACLAIGLGLASWFPNEREHWAKLPGSIPYFIVNLEKERMSDD